MVQEVLVGRCQVLNRIDSLVGQARPFSRQRRDQDESTGVPEKKSCHCYCGVLFGLRPQGKPLPPQHSWSNSRARSKKTDREIDDLVYKLYRITEDERKIIEKGTERSKK